MSDDLQSIDSPPVNVGFSLSSPGARTVSVALFFVRRPSESTRLKDVANERSEPRSSLMVRKLVRLEQVNPGQWSCEVLLPPGWHEYLFVVDGAWVMDPEAPEVRPDGAGEFNAARLVAPVAAVKIVPVAPASVARRTRGSGRRRAV